MAHFGPRFYDVSNIFSKSFRAMTLELAKANGIPLVEGQVFWVNHSAVPSYAHSMVAKGLKSEKLNIKAIIKGGVAEVMAVAHFNAHGENRLNSFAISIVSDAVLTAQSLSPAYMEGVRGLVNLVDRFCQLKK